MTSTAASTALVLLHPFPYDSKVVEPLAAAVREVLPDVPVVTPDLVGQGTPTLDTFADQVVELLDAEGIESAVIGGVSMGGYVTLNLVRRYPKRVAGLVLIDTKASADAPPALEARAQAAAKAESGTGPESATLLRGQLSPVSFERRPQVVTELAEMIDSQPLSTIAWNQRAMAGRPDAEEDLSTAHVPVLVIVGADDTITPPAASHHMADVAPQSTLITIPDTGHLAVYEEPAAVAAAIADWWPQVSARRD
jgi:pimeloyl-ACP methyl ester carboxylesterase